MEDFDMRSIILRHPVEAVAAEIESQFYAWGWEGLSLLNLDPLSRYFVRHELNLRPHRNNGAPLWLIAEGNRLDVADIVERAVATDTARVNIKKNDEVRITKFEILEEENIAVLLFRRSDPDAPAPTFENRKTKRLWDAPKGPDDAESVSAHLFIDLDVSETPHPTYRAILEEVPGLGRTYIQAVLHDLLTRFKYPYIDARGEQKETYTLPKLDGVPSQNLGNAMNGGGINYIELIRPPNVDGLDTAGMVPKPEHMKLLVKTGSKEGALAAINNVREWIGTQKNWRDLRVRVQEGDRSRIVSIAREADAADVLFVHSEPVTVTTPLKQCSDDFSAELIELARQTFSNGNHWRS